EDSVVCQLASPTFDASLKDIFPALISGATLAIVPQQIRTSMHLLPQWLRNNKVTHLQTVPSLFRVLTRFMKEQHDKIDTLRQVVLAGERLYGHDLLAWREVQGTQTAIANMYGLTETTILKSFFEINKWDWDPAEGIPVGKAISNTLIAVIHDGKLCAHGEIGEVYIKSPFTTCGYLNEALNHGLFVQNPLSSNTDIICKTGDIGRYNTIMI